MAQQGPDLGVHVPVDRLQVVHLLRLEQENPSGAMRREVLLGEVVVITGGDDSVEQEPPGVAMVGMEPPISFKGEDLRDEKARVLHAVQPLSTSEVTRHVVRAQYGGYPQEPSVSPTSRTETFTALAHGDAPVSQ